MHLVVQIEIILIISIDNHRILKRSALLSLHLDLLTLSPAIGLLLLKIDFLDGAQISIRVHIDFL